MAKQQEERIPICAVNFPCSRYMHMLSFFSLTTGFCANKMKKKKSNCNTIAFACLYGQKSIKAYVVKQTFKSHVIFMVY